MILGFQAWETGKIMAPLKETGMQKGKLDRNKVVLLGNTHLSGGLLGLQMANCFPYILWEGVRPTALMRCFGLTQRTRTCGHCQSRFCPPPKHPAMALELSSTLVWPPL